MINSVLMNCAGTYLYHPILCTQKTDVQKKERKVEATSSSYHGRRFNSNAGNKACHNHIDILI